MASHMHINHSISQSFPLNIDHQLNQRMGQTMRKLTGKVGEGQAQEQQKEAMRKIIEKYIEDHLQEFESLVKTRDGFYHMVYEIVEHINEKSGAMQYKLPPLEKLNDAFKAVHRHGNLTKDELSKIIEKVTALDSFYVGQGAKDMFLFIFGVPVLALLAKRVIPGPTRLISDDIFIPVATTGAVLFLAKTDRL